MYWSMIYIHHTVVAITKYQTPRLPNGWLISDGHKIEVLIAIEHMSSGGVFPV